jgi:hypothetical protein
MEPEPEPMPDHIIQQDILLDDIKEYRKIIMVLLNQLNNLDEPECKNVFFFSEEASASLPSDYDYEYKGIDNIIIDIKQHRLVIKIIMDRLQDSTNNNCKVIYNECYNSPLYQDYYL